MTELYFGFCFTVLITMVSSWGVTNNLWKQDTVQRGLAIYCPTDGQWAWVGECGK